MARTGKSNIRNHHLSNLNKRNPAQAKRTIERGTRREGDKECGEGEKEHNETSDDDPQEEYTPTTNPEDAFGPLPDMIIRPSYDKSSLPEVVHWAWDGREWRSSRD